MAKIYLEKDVLTAFFERTEEVFKNADNVYIAKITEFVDEEKNKFFFDNFIYDSWGDDVNYLTKEDIKKASYNIIDLIEFGDIVEYIITGDCYIGKVGGHPEFNKWVLHVYYLDEMIDLKELNIKSILTHEQFDNMKYEVK